MRNSFVLQCPTQLELLQLAEGKLDSALRLEITTHVESCASCQREIDEYNDNQKLFLELASVVKSEQEWSSSSRHSTTESDFRNQIESCGYSILDELHRGGQGIVYSAIQVSNNRKVAIKRLNIQDQMGPEIMARFEREIEVATKLSHPNIVTVFDNGMIDHCPYLVMEFVSGLPLNQYVRENLLHISGSRLSRDALVSLLELFKKICDAVGYAHRLGVIHRDLKPGNIVLDHFGEPKILDFGLAKWVERNERELTQTGQFLGTLAYASPEQVQMHVETDTRSDIYSVGVILFELITGKLPYAVDAGISEAIKNIIHQPPTLPSRLNNNLDNDLETIVLKSLNKEPNRRYQSVDQLGRDLDAYISGRPIEAKKDHHVYVLYKSLLRFKGYVFAAAALAVSIIVGLVVSIWFWNQAVIQRNAANESKANESVAREQAELQSYVANIVAAKGAILNNDVAEAKRRLQAAPPTWRGWEWYHYLNRCDNSDSIINVHSLYVIDFEWLPDQQKVISISGDNTIRSWTIDNPQDCSIKQLSNAPIDLAISPQGKVCAVTIGNFEIQLFSGESLSPIKTCRTEFKIKQLEFLNETEVLLLTEQAGQRSKILVMDWSSSSFTELVIPVGSIEGFAIKGDRIAIAGTDSGIYDLASKDYSTFELQGTNSAFFLGDKKIGFANAHKATIVDLEPGFGKVELIGHDLPLNDIIFSDKNSLITVSNDRTIRIWDSCTGRQKNLLRGHDQPVSRVRQIGAQKIMSASSDGTFRIWNTNSSQQPVRLKGHELAVRKIQFSPSGDVFASCSEDGNVIVRDYGTLKNSRILQHENPVFAMSFSRDGKLLATGGDESFIRLWNLKDGTYAKLTGHLDRVHCIDFSTDGRKLISASRDKTVRVWELDSRKCTHIFKDHNECVHACSYHPNKPLIASRSHQDIRLWRSDDLSSVTEFELRISPEDYSLSFHPDGQYLAAGSSIEGFGRGFVGVFDLHSKAESWTLEQHNTPINALTFFPDGKRIASASNESIKIWDFENSVELASLDGVSSFPYCIAVSPDGETLLAGMVSGDLYLWRSERQ